jgi:hypothetical protein
MIARRQVVELVAKIAVAIVEDAVKDEEGHGDDKDRHHTISL